MVLKRGGLAEPKSRNTPFFHLRESVSATGDEYSQPPEQDVILRE